MNKVITISREFGSGGRTIGRKVALKLKWGDVRNYQIALDSGIIGIDKCADIICALYRG